MYQLNKKQTVEYACGNFKCCQTKFYHLLFNISQSHLSSYMNNTTETKYNWVFFLIHNFVYEDIYLLSYIKLLYALCIHKDLKRSFILSQRKVQNNFRLIY